jgi:hypothetical protein
LLAPLFGRESLGPLIGRSAERTRRVNSEGLWTDEAAVQAVRNKGLSSPGTLAAGGDWQTLTCESAAAEAISWYGKIMLTAFALDPRGVLT